MGETCPVDDESLDGDDGEDHDAKGFDEEESFARCFTHATISDHDASRCQAARDATKWRKRKVEGFSRGVLWRAGLGGGDMPEIAQDEGGLGISNGLVERTRSGGSLSELQRGILSLARWGT